MKDNVQLEFNGEFIEVRHPKGFSIDALSMDQYWKMLADACTVHECSVVLVAADAPRREMGTMDAFGSGVRASEIAVTLTLALCFSDYRPDDLSDFFKTVARNRGVRVKFFAERAEALRWLGVRDAVENLLDTE
jgi:hypothetical protein